VKNSHFFPNLTYCKEFTDFSCNMHHTKWVTSAVHYTSWNSVISDTPVNRWVNRTEWVLYLASNPYGIHSPEQRGTNSGREVTLETTFCTVTSKICGSAVWNWLHVTLLVPRVLRWPLDFWKICVHLPVLEK